VSEQSACTGRGRIATAIGTHPGQVRPVNQDAVEVDERLGLLVVCDGVGGAPAGDVASRVAANTVCTQVRRRLLASGGDSLAVVQLDDDILRTILSSALLDAHADVMEEGAKRADTAGMATTATVLLVHGSQAVLAWIGDSPAFLMRSGELRLLTRSHNLERLELPGSRDSSGSQVGKILTAVLGRSASVLTPELALIPMQPGDLFLLCSDGLSDMVKEEQIARLLRNKRSLPDAAQELVDAANRMGGRDNITVALLEVTHVPGAGPRAAASSGISRHIASRWRAVRTSQMLLVCLAGIAGVVVTAAGSAVAWRHSARQEGVRVEVLQRKLADTQRRQHDTAQALSLAKRSGHQCAKELQAAKARAKAQDGIRACLPPVQASRAAVDAKPSRDRGMVLQQPISGDKPTVSTPEPVRGGARRN